MKTIGEITIVVASKIFDENLPVGGKMILTMPDGSKHECEVLDVVDTEWYEDIA